MVQLRDVFEVLMRHVEDAGLSAVTVDKDFYWNVPADKLYNPYETPREPDLDLGQLSEDWEKLQDVSKGKAPPVGSGFVWLSAVLRAVGEEMSI